MKILAVLVALSTLSSVARAENCGALKAGPERAGCMRGEHPVAFDAKFERCRQLARERGDTSRTGTGAGGMKEFVRDCMQGKQR